MSSTSPGHVMIAQSTREHSQATPNVVQEAARRPGTVARSTAQKRGRDSPSTPSRSSALTLFDNLRDSVRTSAVRGLRALTDTIERGRDSASESSSSGPSSPTIARGSTHETPAGKRRRTVRTEERRRITHADWRGAHWDYTGAMTANLFQHVADLGPSGFTFPLAPAEVGADGEEADAHAQVALLPPPRPSSAMSAASAASAPAVLSTPQSHHRHRMAVAHQSPGTDSEGGWITGYTGVADEDPFVMELDGDADAQSAETRPDSSAASLVQAVTAASSLLSADALRTTDVCGAIHAFVSRLQALDPQGNFAIRDPTNGTVTEELRALRTSVDALEAAQRDTAAAMRRMQASHTVHERDDATGTLDATPVVEQTTHTTPPAPAPATTAAPPQEKQQDTSQEGKGAAPATLSTEVGRHDVRRAVFNPSVPFGGRLKGTVSPDALRQLNGSSYVVRDAINVALRDFATARMADPADKVQVMGVNWTERGNLCVVVCDGFTAVQLLEHADTVASAAQLGDKYSASRDVPVFKAVLCNVPTKRADGSLFTEADVLADLGAHSTAFDNLKRADSAEPARWISTPAVRTLKPRSTLLINFATEGDAAKFLAMHRRLYVFGCMCEPGTFQPRDRERVCTRCWNPLARHRERDATCEERCRLCGGKHAEEEHACNDCDVLSKPCSHIGLKCVNCGLGHAADDSVCEFRRRLRGTSQSGPPMSTRPPVNKAGRAKKGKVRILAPDEPFPDDAPEDVDPAATRDAAPGPNRSKSRRGSAGKPAPVTGQELAPGKRGTTATGQEPSSKRTTRASATGQEPTQTQAKTTATGQEPSSSRTKRASVTGQEPTRTRGTDAVGTAKAAATGQEPSPEGDGMQAPATGQEPAPATTSTAATGQEPPPDVEVDDALDVRASIREEDRTALTDLLGESNMHADVSPVTRPSYADAAAGSDARRSSSSRIAASEAGKDDRRRRAAHVLARNFKFLNQKEATAALKARADDFGSTVSWAADEQSKRNKPGMQGKSADSLRQIVDEMSKSSTAPEQPNTSTTTQRANA